MLAATTTELLGVFRDEVDDVVTDIDGSDFGCLWKDREIYGYMTEACDAVARDTNTQYRLISVNYTAGDGVVALPSYVHEIRSIRDADRSVVLEQVNANAPALAQGDDYGQSLGTNVMFGVSSGQPRAYVRDYDARAIRLIPTPSADGTLEIQCSVTIAARLQKDMPVPFAAIPDQRLVLHYMKSLAYRKQDAETEDLVRANGFEALYREGAAARAAELRNVRRAPPVVRMEW